MFRIDPKLETGDGSVLEVASELVVVVETFESFKVEFAVTAVPFDVEDDKFEGLK